MNFHYYECQLCGEPFPFDARFDIDETLSGSCIEERDGLVIPTNNTVMQIVEHVETVHPEVIPERDEQDGFVRVLFERIFKVKEIKGGKQ